MINISLDITDFDLSNLEGLIRVLSRKDLLDEPTAIVYNRVRTRYLEETAPDGTRWIQSQRAKEENRNTLYDTGDLYRSIQLAKGGDNQVFIGTDVPYGYYHQFGTKKMVARKFLGASDGDIEVIQHYLINEVKREARL